MPRQKGNVTAVTAGVASVDETSVTDTNGQKYEVDAIICATGFDISFRPRFPLLGRNNVDLRDKWNPRSKAYHSMFVDGN
jgi:cation diffusion facilitator CzcD-associated flavoprotein CzcO